MKNAKISIFFYGIYALGAGLGFLFFHNTILQFFGFATTDEHWILVVAILTLGLAYYYISSARAENRHFFRISWHGRMWFFLASTAIALMGIAPLNLILIGSVDLITAIWTVLALRSV